MLVIQPVRNRGVRVQVRGISSPMTLAVWARGPPTAPAQETPISNKR
jgi:hypothetical protein